MADQVQSGLAQFGQGQYGVLTKPDSARLIRLAILGAQAHPAEGYALRKLIRQLMPAIGPANALMLADVAEASCNHQAEWKALAAELRRRGGEQ